MTLHLNQHVSVQGVIVGVIPARDLTEQDRYQVRIENDAQGVAGESVATIAPFRADQLQAEGGVGIGEG